MKETNEVKVLVTLQGDAVCGKQGYMLKRSEDVAAFYLDGWGKTGRIYAMSTCSSTRMAGEILHYPSMTIEDGEDDSSISEICFPEYEGWRVHCTSGGKTMAICLIKED